MTPLTSQRRTKIVATIGPASADPAVLRRLFAAGVNVARVTLAHGTVTSQRELVQTIRREADAAAVPVGILLDLPGPKVRTTRFRDSVEVARDARVRLVTGTDTPSTASTFVIDYPTLADLHAGDTVVVGDGAVQLLVERSEPDGIDARVTSGGRLSGRKGVSIPSKRFRGEVPTAEDLALITAFRDEPIDIVAVSFVRTAEDLVKVRAALGANPPWVMAKIETAAAVDHLDEIVRVADAVMVARGDLGTELPIEAVPHLQKRIIRETVRHGKPALVATQMLESMIEAPTPTRAEASDVANAVLDHASALMLSAETAVGHDPVLVIETMDRLIRRAEDELQPATLQAFALDGRDLTDINVATAHAAGQLAADLSATAILCCTRTGATARKMASFRPLAPLVGLTADVRAIRQMALCWGVQPLHIQETSDATSIVSVMRVAIGAARQAGLVATGDVVIVLAGSPQAGPGHTDSVRVVRVGTERGERPAVSVAFAMFCEDYDPARPTDLQRMTTGIGGWSADEPPTVPLTLAVGLWNTGAPGAVHCRVGVRRPGDPIVYMGEADTLMEEPGEMAILPLRLTLTFDRPGIYWAVCEFDGQPLVEVPFSVSERPSPAFRS